MNTFYTLSSLLTFVIGYFFKDLSKLIRQIRVEEYKGKNERDIQRESFFRQIKGEELARTLNYWSTFVSDMNHFSKNLTSSKGISDMNEMQKLVLMYGSEKSVQILSEMMQHFYNKVEDEKGYMGMLYIAYLISSLKYDFTGYKIDPIIILRTKIKGFDFSEIDKEHQKIKAIFKKSKVI